MMSTSVHDMNLIVRTGGKETYYSTVKGGGNLIWDVRLGIFGADVAALKSSLDFVRGTKWEDCIALRKTPLNKPAYGSVTIDFDRKFVTDSNSYGRSDEMILEWVDRSIAAAMSERADGLVAADSLKDHLANQRIVLHLYESFFPEPKLLEDAQSIVLPADFTEARKTLHALRYEGPPSGGYMARLKLPPDWTFVDP